MQIFRLSRASSVYGISTNHLISLFEKKLIPHIKKVSASNRSSYYLPSLFVDYAKNVLNFERVEDADGNMSDFYNKNGTKIK